PTLCVAVIRKYATLSPEDALHGSHQTRTSFLSALRRRYQLSTAPSALPSLLQAGDCVTFILQAAALEPWTLPGSTLAQASYQKLLLVQLLENDVVACLVSYVVMETDNLRHTLAAVSQQSYPLAPLLPWQCPPSPPGPSLSPPGELLTQVDGQMSAILLQAESASAVVQQQLRDLRLQMAAIRQQLDAARTSGRMQEEWVHELLDQQCELQRERRLLTRCLASHQQSCAELTSRAAAMVACNARLMKASAHTPASRSSFRSSLAITLATTPKGSRVRRSTPRLATLQQAIALLSWLLTPPPPPANSVVLLDDGGLLMLRARLHSQALSGGLVQACLRCAHNAKACEGWMLEAVAMLRGLEVQAQLSRVMQRGLEALRADAAALQGLDVRLRVRAKAVQEEAKRVRKALMLDIPREAALQRHRLAGANALSAFVREEDVRQRAIQLKQEAAQELSKARGNVAELTQRLTALASEADVQLQALTAAHTTVEVNSAHAPSPPPVPSNGNGRDGDPLDAAAGQGAGARVSDAADSDAVRAGGLGALDSSLERPLLGSELCTRLPVPLLLSPDLDTPAGDDKENLNWITHQQQHYQQQPGSSLVALLSMAMQPMAKPSETLVELLQELGWAVDVPASNVSVLGTRPFSANMARKSMGMGSVTGESLLASSGAGSVAASAWWGMDSRSQAASSHTPRSTPRSAASRHALGLEADTGYGGGLTTMTLLEEASTLVQLMASSVLLLPGPPPGPLRYATPPEASAIPYPVLPPTPSVPLSPSLPPTPFQFRPLPSLPPTPGPPPGPAPFDPLGAEGDNSPPWGEAKRHAPAAVQPETDPREGAAAVTPPPIPLIQLLSRQAADLAQALAHITLVGVTCRGLARSAALLPASGPAYSSLSASHREQWAGQVARVKLGFASLAPARLLPHLPDLMRCWTGCMQMGEPADAELLAGAVAEIADIGYTPPDSFAKVYVQSGMLSALLKLLALGRVPQHTQQAQWSTEFGRTAPPKNSPAAKGRFAGKASSRRLSAQQASRPPDASLVAQKEAARALVSIGQHHPEALVAVAADKALLATVVALADDLSIARPVRHQAARLLSALLLVGQPLALGTGESVSESSPAWDSVVDATLAAGAFHALLQLIDSDHRSVAHGSKPMAMRALSSVVSHPARREAVAKLHVDTVDAHMRRQGKAAALHNHAAALAGLKPAIVAMQTEQGVALALARALWSVPRQLHQIMTSDATSKGRLVEPAILSAMAELGCTAAQELELLAGADREARDAVQSLGLAVRINPELMTAVRDPALHAALLKLKAQLA
ncbi:hypothetical protein QJQ45_005699, partial [Haematococcus lacustris]